MAEEIPPEPTPTRRSALPRMMIVVGAMLAIAVIVNWKYIVAIASGEKTLKAVLTGKSEEHGDRPTFSFPEPSGPEDAKVKVYVVAREGYSCHEPLVALWAAVGTLEKERLRVEFCEITDVPPHPDGHRHELGCDCGVVINDQTKFEIGEGEDERTLYLTGPTPMGIELPPDGPGPSGGMGGHGGWGPKDVATILNQHIEAEYGDVGSFTGEAIQHAMSAGAAPLPPPREGQLAASREGS